MNKIDKKLLRNIKEDIQTNGGITVNKDIERSIEIKKKMNLGFDHESMLDLFGL